MTDSADHVTGKTGLTCTVTLSKAGGSFASPAGAVTEIANGWYKVAGNATDTGTLGSLILHATASGADTTDVLYEVMSIDPQATTFGLSLAKTTNLTGFNDLDAAGIRTATGLASANLDTQIAALPTAAQIFAATLTTQLTEAYAADGVAPTLAQAIFLIQQSLHEFAIASTTRTVKKLDGTTTAATFTLNDAVNPTSTTRAT